MARAELIGDVGTARVHSFAGEPAVTLTAGPTELTVLPELGLLGASLRHHGLDHLDLHGGPGAVRSGHTSGMPLLAPWANRLSGRRYRSAGRTVDLTGAPGLHVDGNGLPIHGTFVGRAGWQLDAVRTASRRASIAARFDAGADPQVMDSFPFPHLVEVTYTVRPGTVSVRTAIVPTGSAPVPVSFGWHPYFRVPGEGRDALRVELPDRHRLVLDERQIPTGEEVHERAEVLALAGGAAFDDGYRLGRRRRLALVGRERAVSVSFDPGYPFAQVYAPEGRDFVALEPMTATTDALVRGTAAVVAPGARFAARFDVTLTAPTEEPR